MGKKLPFYNEKPYNYRFDKPLKRHEWFYKFWTPVAALVLKIKFSGFEIHGLENIPKKGGFIIAGNHISGFDPINIAYILRKKCKLCFMAKDEFFHTFYTRFMLFGFNGFPVKRGTADRSALDYAINSINDGFSLLIFPQGTRDKANGRPEKGKSGVALIAREAKADILPVSIQKEFIEGSDKPKMIFRFGEVIPYKDLGFKEGQIKQSDLRRVTQLVMKDICELWDLDDKSKNK